MTNGLVVTGHGRHFMVEVNGHCYECSTRGKKNHFVCGDHVSVELQNSTQGVIEHHLARHSLLYRQDIWRSKLIAANVTQIVIVTAAVPSPSEALLNRALIAAEAAGITPLIVINKSDLAQSSVWHETLRPYNENLGYPVLTLSALQDISTFTAALRGHCNVLLGQSGMGKTTLLNALLPGTDAHTNNISTALDSGRHTTTHATLYHLDAETDLIDSPGLQSFGLQHIEPTSLVHYFPEMRPFIGQCRFHNCTHRQEPGCAIKSVYQTNPPQPDRLSILHLLTNELEEGKKHQYK